jgi:hypothetical protein
LFRHGWTSRGRRRHGTESVGWVLAGVSSDFASFEIVECVLAHVEEVHRFRDVDERVGVVLEAELLALMIEVGFDEEIGAENGR